MTMEAVSAKPTPMERLENLIKQLKRQDDPIDYLLEYHQRAKATNVGYVERGYYLIVRYDDETDARRYQNDYAAYVDGEHIGSNYAEARASLIEMFLEQRDQELDQLRELVGNLTSSDNKFEVEGRYYDTFNEAAAWAKRFAAEINEPYAVLQTHKATLAVYQPDGSFQDFRQAEQSQKKHNRLLK